MFVHLLYSLAGSCRYPVSKRGLWVQKTKHLVWLRWCSYVTLVCKLVAVVRGSELSECEAEHRGV